MSFNFDTGSSILWLPTVDCTTCTATPNQYDYNTGGGTFTGVDADI